MKLNFRYGPALLVALLVSTVFFFIAFQINRVMDNPDFMVYWLAGNLVNRGESPYNIQLWSSEITQLGWFTDQTFLYPYQTALFFTFWGGMPYRYAYTIWIFLMMVLFTATVLMGVSLWRGNAKVRYLFPLIAGLVVFRPVLVSVRNGQIGALLLFAFTCSMVLFDRKRWFWSGAVLSILFFKPNIAVPFLSVILLVAIMQRAWRLIAGLLAGGLVQLVVSLVLEPTWLQQYLLIGQRKLDQTFGYSPTLWGLGHQICGKEMGCSIGLGAVFSALLVAWFVVWLIKARPGLILAAAAAVSLMLVVTPFGWAYEQVWLVFPIVLITGNFRNRWPFLVSSMLFLIISMVSLALLLVAMQQQMDVVSFLVPLLVFILTTLSGSQKNTITNLATV